MSFAPERCRSYRRRILDISQHVGALHIAPAFSCIEILDALYNTLMRPQDILILSKGHAAIAQYVILEARGVLSAEDLDSYCTPRGRLGAHPDCGTPGMNASTGSLGHGLGIAVGQALACPDVSVYVLLSDGELQEGSTWEALLVAGNLRLRNLVALVDNNDWTGMERISRSYPAFYPIGAKASAFGWSVTACDGHDEGSILRRFTMRGSVRPFMLICETTKGKGISFTENAALWHYRSPNPEEYARGCKELENDKAL